MLAFAPVGCETLSMRRASSASGKRSAAWRPFLPGIFGKNSRTGLEALADGDESLDNHTAIAGADGQRAAQSRNPFAHSRQAESQSGVWFQSAAIVANTDKDAARGLQARKLLRWFDGYIDRSRACVAKNVRQRLLDGAIDRQIGRLAGLAERLRNRGLDRHAPDETPSTGAPARRSPRQGQAPPVRPAAASREPAG